ncbi:hypothetical protein F5Y05DRAFT_410404 [Hypoxylon sp. FL0543]|nr:hypothetical protein F5Y05DRAFT_410404 [Hypoxylon sp. FL0543]
MESTGGVGTETAPQRATRLIQSFLAGFVALCLCQNIPIIYELFLSPLIPIVLQSLVAAYRSFTSGIYWNLTGYYQVLSTCIRRGIAAVNWCLAIPSLLYRSLIFALSRDINAGYDAVSAGFHNGIAKVNWCMAVSSYLYKSLVSSIFTSINDGYDAVSTGFRHGLARLYWNITRVYWSLIARILESLVITGQGLPVLYHRLSTKVDQTVALTYPSSLTTKAYQGLIRAYNVIAAIFHGGLAKLYQLLPTFKSGSVADPPEVTTTALSTILTRDLATKPRTWYEVLEVAPYLALKHVIREALDIWDRYWAPISMGWLLIFLLWSDPFFSLRWKGLTTLFQASKLALLAGLFIFRVKPRRIKSVDMWTARFWREIVAYSSLVIHAGTLFTLSAIVQEYFGFDLSMLVFLLVLTDTLLLFVNTRRLWEFIPFYTWYIAPTLKAVLRKRGR